MKSLIYMTAFLSILSFSAAAEISIAEKSIRDAFANRNGGCVFMDCKSDSIIRYNPSETVKRITPCSSFKIWNTLIGLECNIITSPNEPFYKWDGEKRSIPDWNKDLTLKDAFSVSCVPAFQNLARRIGAENMQKWIDTIHYGDCDISSGTDIFWLPKENKKSIKISPEEQANLIRRLVTGQLPFSKKSQMVLKEIMTVSATSDGTIYGKTGTGTDIDGNPKQNIGWFVGYAESGSKTYSFACIVRGENLMGKDARNIVETILKQNGLL